MKAKNPEREAYQQALMKLIGSHPVAYWPHLARLVGGVKAAVMLSQLLYWNGNPNVIKRDGWVLKSVEEMEKETGLTTVEQQTARNTLKENNIIQCVLKGVPRIWHYRVDVDVLGNVLIDPQTHSMDKSLNGEVIEQESHSTEIPVNIGRDSRGRFTGKVGQPNMNLKTTSKTTSSKTTSSSSTAPTQKEEEVSNKSFENLSAEFVQECRAIGVFDKLLPEVARAVAGGITEQTLMDLMDEVEKKEPNPPRTGALFMWRLRNAPPGQQLSKDDRDAIKRKSYITGEFADFIQH